MRYPLDLLLLMPMLGALTILVAAFLSGVVYCIFRLVLVNIFVDMQSACQRLGAWLVVKTKAS